MDLNYTCPIFVDTKNIESGHWSWRNVINFKGIAFPLKDQIKNNNVISMQMHIVQEGNVWTTENNDKYIRALDMQRVNVFQIRTNFQRPKQTKVHLPCPIHLKQEHQFKNKIKVEWKSHTSLACDVTYV